MCYVKGGLGGLPPSKRVRCVSEIFFAMGEAQFTFSSNDYFTASCILATGETLVLNNQTKGRTREYEAEIIQWENQ